MSSQCTKAMFDNATWSTSPPHLNAPEVLLGNLGYRDQSYTLPIAPVASPAPALFSLTGKFKASVFSVGHFLQNVMILEDQSESTQLRLIQMLPEMHHGKLSLGPLF
ncbi:unnamed protein product [Pleuronectes platessa]|uniref:Uncharacterized protein n=1 Tax=Pleuronectes platessa TaxID=8262 RepID=A0A9N7YIF5_PLEPL|nr:unnamed protein product [Pleuronectes platessa]